jgi:uncharacterized protein (UPF0371 family)
VQLVADVNGVCSATLVLRAGTDDETRALKTAAANMNAAVLTETNQVVLTAPATSSGSLSLGAATVSEVTLTGQKVGNAGPSVSPSFFLVAAIAGLWWA